MKGDVDTGDHLVYGVHLDISFASHTLVPACLAVAAELYLGKLAKYIMIFS